MMKVVMMILLMEITVGVDGDGGDSDGNDGHDNQMMKMMMSFMLTFHYVV